MRIMGLDYGDKTITLKWYTRIQTDPEFRHLGINGVFL